jgi:hypothetical protein
VIAAGPFLATTISKTIRCYTFISNSKRERTRIIRKSKLYKGILADFNNKIWNRIFLWIKRQGRKLLNSWLSFILNGILVTSYNYRIRMGPL